MDYQMDVPIYLQIMKDMKQKIISGQWETGMHVSSVRDLAIVYRVNPNTMQRALSEMEREGLMASDRTSGRFVTRNAEKIKEKREEMIVKIVQGFLEETERMGLSREQTIEWITKEEG